MLHYQEAALTLTLESWCGPAFFLRCSHSFHTFSSQKQGAYEHAAAAGSRPSGEDDADDDVSDARDVDACADADAAAPPLGDGDADADDVGRTGDLLPLPALGLLRRPSIHSRH